MEAGVKAWEVIGIAVNGEFVCCDCTKTREERDAFVKGVENISPLFASDADGDETCGRCGQPLVMR
jgi:hypothetical protein